MRHIFNDYAFNTFFQDSMFDRQIEHQIIKHENNDLSVNFSFAGFSKDQINVFVEGDEIIIKTTEPTKNKTETLLRDFSTSRFNKLIISLNTLSNYVAGSKQNVYKLNDVILKDGILSIKLKVDKKTEPRKVTIN